MKDYIQKIINHFISSPHSEKVTKEVHQWLLEEDHADEKEAALYKLWSETEAKADESTWISLASIYEKVGRGKYAPEKKFYFKKIYKYAAAIVLLVISVSGTYFYTKNISKDDRATLVELFTPAGEMNTVELPDGSKVQTNSGTLLLYPEDFEGDARVVYLIGEANFKIKKNPQKPFIVKSTTVSITALGTEFNVEAYPNNAEIIASLLSGKIKVDCGEEQKSYILNPGQQVIYQKKTKKSRLANTNLEDVVAWQKGLCVFRGSTIQEIFSVLGRRFNITFQCNISSLNTDKYNFSFSQSSGIQDIMDVMKEVIGGFDYKIEGDVCYIKSLNDRK